MQIDNVTFAFRFTNNSKSKYVEVNVPYKENAIKLALMKAVSKFNKNELKDMKYKLIGTRYNDV